MSRVNVPGEGLIDFPDEMGDDEILAAIKKFPSQSQPQQQDLNAPVLNDTAATALAEHTRRSVLGGHGHPQTRTGGESQGPMELMSQGGTFGLSDLSSAGQQYESEHPWGAQGLRAAGAAIGALPAVTSLPARAAVQIPFWAGVGGAAEGAKQIKEGEFDPAALAGHTAVGGATGALGPIAGSMSGFNFPRALSVSKGPALGYLMSAMGLPDAVALPIAWKTLEADLARTSKGSRLMPWLTRGHGPMWGKQGLGGEAQNLISAMGTSNQAQRPPEETVANAYSAGKAIPDEVHRLIGAMMKYE